MLSSRLSSWFPIVKQVLPEHRYPQTIIVPGPPGFELLHLLDGHLPDGYNDFIERLEEAALRVGPYPVFLRHDASSAKHEWAGSCFVTAREQLPGHVAQSVEYWECVNMFSEHEYDTWAVREYLPIDPVVMTAFKEMPIGPERRYLVVDGQVREHFPYWPIGAFWRPEPDVSMLLEYTAPPGPQSPPKALLRQIGQISLEADPEVAELTLLAETAGQALGGSWSIDFMHTARGWVLIDCALLQESWRPDAQDREYWRQAITLAGE